MKAVLPLLLGCYLIGCGGSEPEPASGSGGGGAAGGLPASGGGGGTATLGGSSGAPAGGGAAGSTAGGAGSSTGGSTAGAAGITGGGSSAGASGAAGTAGGGAATCTPSPAGALSVVGDAVHDAKTCLDWMRAGHNGVNYAAAESYCADLSLGGFDDWRIPTVSELASLVTRCGKYPPEGPIDTTVFELPGDGYWTVTSAGEPNKVCAIGMLNAGGYYHYGTAGPQVVRCVRGTGTFSMVKDCTAATGCSNWAQ